MRQHIGERYYGTQHTTSGYPLNRKSVSCPRAYRAFLVTRNFPTSSLIAVVVCFASERNLFVSRRADEQTGRSSRGLALDWR